MKKSFLCVLLAAALQFAVVGCGKNPHQSESIHPSEQSALSSGATAPSWTQAPVPESDEAALRQDFVSEMERQGITEGNLKTLENSGIPQAQIMEMTAQEILAKLEEIRSVFQQNKMDTVRELLSDWGLAANDEQFVYVGQQGTLRLERVEELGAAFSLPKGSLREVEVIEDSPQRDETLYCKDISQIDWLTMTGWKIAADSSAYDYLVG